VKIIEGMKKIKELQIKSEDLRRKIGTYCVDLAHETPMYGADQKNKIREWIQGHCDITKEILRLRVAIQKTNIVTNVTIELGGKQVTKTVAEWIHRRRDLSDLDLKCWAMLTDRNLREGTVTISTGEKQEVKIRRYYDPAERDTAVELYRSEPSRIDSTLEITNAVTDLIE
jgi:hypothetical protein